MPSFVRFRSFHRTSRKLVETSPLKPMGVISKGGKKKKPTILEGEEPGKE